MSLTVLPTAIRKFVYTHITDILLFLICCIVLTKLVATYTDTSRVPHFPELAFSSPLVGRDLTAYTTMPVYTIREGQVPFIFGYGSVTIADVLLHTMEALHICSMQQSMSCDYVLYIMLISCGTLGLAALIWYIVRDTKQRILAYTLYISILLGVPFSKAVEAGNLDIVLSVLYGIVLGIVLRYSGRRIPVYASLSIGALLGVLLSTKAFFIAFVLVTAALVVPNTAFIFACIVSYTTLSLWPLVYGVHTGLFDVFAFAMRGSDAFGPQLYTQINYGNNALISYISNLLQSIDTHRVSLPLHIALTHTIALAVGLLVCVHPFFAEKGIIATLRMVKQRFNTGVYPVRELAIVLYAYATALLILLPAWSYDYRLLYLFPVLLALIQYTKTARSKELLYWSVIFLLCKCMWIPKDRFMNIWLYAHIYFLLRSATAVWSESILGARTSQIGKER